MEINDVLEAEDLDEGLILACQARPVSDEAGHLRRLASVTRPQRPV